MTTIAFKAGVLAGDSAWQYNDAVVSHANKLTRFPTGVLYGAAGEADDRQLVSILRKIKIPAKLPFKKELVELEDVVALVVFPIGSIWVVGSGGAYELKADYAAVGTGAHYALAAMEAGKSAAEAVAVACKLDINSRLPVHTLKLGGKK